MVIFVRKTDSSPFIVHLPSGRLKTSGFALGFQHFPRDLANVNEWKIMFDPSIIANYRMMCLLFRLHIFNKAV